MWAWRCGRGEAGVEMWARRGGHEEGARRRGRTSPRRGGRREACTHGKGRSACKRHSVFASDTFECWFRGLGVRGHRWPAWQSVDVANVRSYRPKQTPPALEHSQIRIGQADSRCRNRLAAETTRLPKAPGCQNRPAAGGQHCRSNEITPESRTAFTFLGMLRTHIAPAYPAPPSHQHPHTCSGGSSAHASVPVTISHSSTPNAYTSPAAETTPCSSVSGAQ
eukprot:363572-Chlamydomonas_euryale.AAC.2